MTRWTTIKIIAAFLVCIGLGVVLIAIGLQEAAHDPYHPSPNAVTPYTFAPPRDQSRN